MSQQETMLNLLPEFSQQQSTTLGQELAGLKVSFELQTAKPDGNMTSASAVTEGIEIEPSSTDLTRRVSSSLGASASPKSFHTPPWSKSGSHLTRATTGSLTKQLKPFATEDIKILLLENVNVTGRDLLKSQGYQVAHLKSALPEDELIEMIRWGNA